MNRELADRTSGKAKWLHHERVGREREAVTARQGKRGRIGKGTLFTRMHGVIGSQVLFDANIPRLPGLPQRVEFAF